MLQSIRDRTQGWIASVIISILILSFALWGIHSYLESGANNTVAADVNGIEISKNQVNVAYERMRRQLQMQNNSAQQQLSTKAESELKARALETIINLQVLKQASLDQNYRVSYKQINNFLEGMPEFQVNGRFSRARFEKILDAALYNISEFVELVRTSLLIDQPRLGLIFTSFALPGEVSETMNLLNQERDLSYLMIPFSVVAKQPIQITEEQQQRYYKSHLEEFKTPEQVSIEYVELPIQSLMASVQPSDEDLLKYYKENNGVYSTPQQWKLETLLLPLKANATDQAVKLAENLVVEIGKQIKSGKDLKTISQKFKLEQGYPKLQGWLTINAIPSELQNAVMALTKADAVSQPLRTPNGIVFIKAVSVKVPVTLPFAQVKEKVKTAYVHQQAEEKFSEMRDKLASATYEHPDSLEQAAKTFNIPIKTSQFFTKDKGGKDITSDTRVREIAFSNDVLTLKNNSDVIALNESAMVLRIKKYLPAATLPLNEVQTKIDERLKLLEIQNKTEKLAKEVDSQLKKGANFEQIAHQNNLVWTNLGYIPRQGTKIDAAILEAAFTLAKPAAKPTYTSVKLPDGYAVVAVKSVRNTDADKTDLKSSQAFADQLQNTEGLVEYELYKQSLIQQAKIQIQS